MLDYKVQQRLVKLLEAATDKKMPSVEPAVLKEIKSLVRTSNEYIASAHDVLTERLKARHAQVRLHAVDIFDELFMRSKAFRDLVSPSFDRFLQLAVGYRSRDPLPGPADCAENLRTKALAAVQRWERAFGMHYPQISFGCRYLKDSLKYSFPAIEQSSGPREREEEARRRRTQELLREKFAVVDAEWASHSRDFRTLLSQLDGSLQLLDDVKRAPRDDTPDGEEDLEWEEAGDGFGYGYSGEEEEEQEGLRGYAVFDDVAQKSDARDASLDGSAGPRAEEEGAILETLSEGAAILSQTHLQRLAEQLQVLVKVVFDGLSGEAASNSRRQLLLREAVDLRRDAEEALRRCREAGARLPEAAAGGGSGGQQQQALPVPAGASRGAAEGAAVVEVRLGGGGGGDEEAERLQQQLMESPEALLARQLASSSSSSSGPAGKRPGRGGVRARGAGPRGGALRRPEKAHQLSSKAADSKTHHNQREMDRAHNNACMSGLMGTDEAAAAADPGGAADALAPPHKSSSTRARIEGKMGKRARRRR